MRQVVDVTVQPKYDGVHQSFPLSSKPQLSQLLVVKRQAFVEAACAVG